MSAESLMKNTNLGSYLDIKTYNNFKISNANTQFLYHVRILGPISALEIKFEVILITSSRITHIKTFELLMLH